MPSNTSYFFEGIKAYSRNALVDLGCGKSGFLWAGKAANLYSPLKIDLFNIQKNGALMVGGMSGTNADMVFLTRSFYLIIASCIK